jgi:hypothetical protein
MGETRALEPDYHFEDAEALKRWSDAQYAVILGIAIKRAHPSKTHEKE